MPNLALKLKRLLYLKLYQTSGVFVIARNWVFGGRFWGIGERPELDAGASSTNGEMMDAGFGHSSMSIEDSRLLLALWPGRGYVR